MTNSGVEEILDSVRSIVPRLRENGNEAEDRRWIPDENIELLQKAGVFRIATPRRFGGLDLSLEDKCKVLAEIARGCPSTGWVAMVWVSNGWIAGLASDQAQEEIYTSDSVRISGGFTPTGSLTPTEGGFLLNGNWRFNSGCRGADWNLAAAILETPDGGHEEVVAAVPMAEFTIADDWNTSAAAGTGSSTSTAKDVFVPAHRVVSLGEALYGGNPDRHNAGATGRNYGLISLVMAECAATFIGMAQGAYELFLERVPNKPIAYTSYTDQRQHPVAQVQVAQAANKITASREMAAAWLRLMQERADTGELLTHEEKAVVRGQTSYAIQLAKEAIEELYTASGASAIQRSVPIQRFFRDSQGFSLHGLLALQTNLEVQGRVLFGLDPETPFL
ncbi:acyl-CoA dehydrogenase family protein [Streptomyces sp. NPDC048370]|uniref:acyl-CoA dehydrogenase family protein n=1 Tax=unclassified Streptomyces TaxID=2593676 RepID=UPI0033D7786F